MQIMQRLSYLKERTSDPRRPCFTGCPFQLFDLWFLIWKHLLWMGPSSDSSVLCLNDLFRPTTLVTHGALFFVHLIHMTLQQHVDIIQNSSVLCVSFRKKLGTHFGMHFNEIKRGEGRWTTVRLNSNAPETESPLGLPNNPLVASYPHTGPKICVRI